MTSTVFFAVKRVSSTAIAAATMRKNSKNPRVGNSIAVQPAADDRGEALILGKRILYHSEEVFRIASTGWRNNRQAEGSAGMPPPTIVSVPDEAGIEFASESITAKNSGMGVGRGGAVRCRNSVGFGVRR